MIVVMKKNASTADVQHMVDRIENLGLKPHVIVGTERTVIAAVGDDRKTTRNRWKAVPAWPRYCRFSPPIRLPAWK